MQFKTVMQRIVELPFQTPQVAKEIPKCSFVMVTIKPHKSQPTEFNNKQLPPTKSLLLLPIFLLNACDLWLCLCAVRTHTPQLYAHKFGHNTRNSSAFCSYPLGFPINITEPNTMENDSICIETGLCLSKSWKFTIVCRHRLAINPQNKPMAPPLP